MIRSRARWLVALVLAFGLLAAACGSDSKKGGGGGTTSSTKPAPKLAAATLNGSGSTFQQAFDEAVIQQFKTLQPAVTVTYAGGGSGQGQTDLAAGTKQWAGTDSLVKPEDMSKFQGPFLYFPTVAAPITVSYNLSGVKDLKLSADTIAGIFSGKITKWDDAAIKAENPSASLPSTAITVAHRADPSGTTANFTKYLVAAAPTAWTLGTDKTVNWPSGQQAGNANSGVAQIVHDTNGAIGYVDYSDAKAAQLVFASVKNASGKFVAPSLESATAALAGATVAADLTYNPLNAPGATAYPITSPTFIMVYQKQSDPAVAAALKGFLGYMLGDGQQLASQVDFAGLPDSILTKAKAQIAKIGS
ncbi:MAG: phosphate ABC transporter substrate-binding protein PstS [Acidimicrobiia bacterium]